MSVMVSFSWLPECLHWPFCPGVFIAILAFVAAVVTFRDPGKTEKAIWILVFLGLMSGEVWMMSKDRTETNRKQKETRDAEIASFKSIGEGIQTSNANSQSQFAITLSRFKQNIETITGGGSFCYLAVGSDGFPTFVHSGDFPLAGVRARIVDMQKWNQVVKPNPHPSMQEFLSADTHVALGDFPPHTAIPNFGVIQLVGQTERDFNIFFNARNGFWTQELRLKFIDGEWLSASRVTRMEVGNKNKTRKIFEKIDKGFPLNANGEVDWQ
jgi:hypothetical protein